MVAYDYYRVADEVCERLSLAGLESRASKIRDAIASGSTGTEILMTLRFELKELSKERDRIPVDLNCKIQSLVEQIHTALS